MSDFEKSHYNSTPNKSNKESLTPLIELLESAKLLEDLRNKVGGFDIAGLTASENTPKQITINGVTLEGIEIKDSTQFHNVIQYIMTIIKVYKENGLNPKENEFYLGTGLMGKIIPTGLAGNDIMLSKSGIDITYGSEEGTRKVFGIPSGVSSRSYVEKVVVFLNKLLKQVNFEYDLPKRNNKNTIKT